MCVLFIQGYIYFWRLLFFYLLGPFLFLRVHRTTWEAGLVGEREDHGEGSGECLCVCVCADLCEGLGKRGGEVGGRGCGSVFHLLFGWNVSSLWLPYWEMWVIHVVLPSGWTLAWLCFRSSLIITCYFNLIGSCRPKPPQFTYFFIIFPFVDSTVSLHPDWWQQSINRCTITACTWLKY